MLPAVIYRSAAVTGPHERLRVHNLILVAAACSGLLAADQNTAEDVLLLVFAPAMLYQPVFRGAISPRCVAITPSLQSC